MDHPHRGQSPAPPAGQRPLLEGPDEEVEFTLLELVDRLLHRGVVIAGDATISVAGVDLVYLGLNLVLSAVETLHQRSAEAAADEGRAGAEGPRTEGVPEGEAGR
ncbi:MAG TPA: gas vesicle protein [Chloroflexota bacterium]|nr:gas vesicle protein [Chloroflexota bacterium]